MTSSTTSKNFQNAKNLRKWQDLIDVCEASILGGTCWRPTLCAFTLCYGKESIVGTVRIGVNSIHFFQGEKKKIYFKPNLVGGEFPPFLLVFT